MGALAQQAVQRRQLLLPYPQFTNATVINSTSGNSVYHSVQLKAVKRMSQGVSLLVSYTGAKLIADVNNQLAPIGPSSSSGVQNYYDLRAALGVSEMDGSRQLAVSFVGELPFGPGKPLLAGLCGNCRPARGRMADQQHRFAPLRAAFDVVGGGRGRANRPNTIGQSARIDAGRPRGEAIERWFDIAQFTQRAPYTLGNVGRTLPDVRSPGMTNLDVSLIKNTAVTERANLQLRAEALNAMNTPFLWLPNTNVNPARSGPPQDCRA